MRITIDIDDTRLLDELNAVNGTRSVERARAKLRGMLRESAISLLVDSGMVDSAIDRIINDAHRKNIVRALTEDDK